MKKIFKLNNLDCANCAAKIENKINEIDGVDNVSISFMTQKMILDVVDEKEDELTEIIKEVCSKIEPDIEIEEK